MLLLAASLGGPAGLAAAVTVTAPGPVSAVSPAKFAELSAPGSPRVYTADQLATIAMPVGGIYAGQLYFKGDGSLSHWDIMNGRGFGSSPLVRRWAQVAQGFSVRVRDAAGALASFPLNLKTFPATTFTADYPAGVVNYLGANKLPLSMTLEGIAPFVPLDTLSSGIPATFLRLTLKNSSAEAVEGDVLGWLENGVLNHSGFRAEEGHRVSAARKLKGALAIEFSADPSAAALANTAKPLSSLLLANFETTDFMGWKSAGSAFGISPLAYKDLPGQKPGNMQGSACASSLATAAGPAALGTLESPEFTLDRNSLAFRLAGDRDDKNLRVELRSGNEVLFTAYPWRSTELQLIQWDLRPHVGKKARLVVTDASEKSGLTLDQVELMDNVLPPITERPDFGTLALTLLAPDASAQALPSVTGNLAGGAAPAPAALRVPFDQTQLGALTAPFRLQAGESRTFTFAIAWHFPNFELSDWGKVQGTGRWYSNQYASASAVVDKLAADGPGLVSAIDLWRKTYYDSTLPRWLLDRSIANLSTLATGTSHRFADGRFYGFEGVYSFPGTCNHVWHYEEGAGRLFPELEKSLRVMADYLPGVGIKTDGSLPMRIDGQPGSLDPLPSQPTLFGNGYQHWASIDGQCGILLRTYRTHLLGTDDSFVKSYWPQIRLAAQWLIAQDSDGDGLPDLVTHHTLDEDIAGPGAWISSMNLAALTAVEKMARIAGDQAFAGLCQERIATGQKNFLAKLWNGDRFIHISPVGEKWRPGSYDGSHIDQVLGQQWAWRTGLGRILPEKETRAALASIYRNNFMEDVGPYYSLPENKPARPFSKPGNAGTLMATWPEGSYRPDGKNPDHLWNGGNYFHQGFYNETMSGFEHAYASHLIYEGMVAEGLTVARAIHDRHQPESPTKGNPFNEPEAGNHYARAMASYATFLACAGFEYDGPAGVIGFAPRLGAENFKAAFTAAEGWGAYRQQYLSDNNKLEAGLIIKRGEVNLSQIKLALPKPTQAVRKLSVSYAGKKLSARPTVEAGAIRITLARPLVLTPGNELTLVVTQ
ncbi:MAG: GH116 family glycosyl hydrolase [Verrucomicrobia bacterium]|nr:GH116 family glycosyl hydrolase [Verrucomicrobiota bacterium]